MRQHNHLQLEIPVEYLSTLPTNPEKSRTGTNIHPDCEIFAHNLSILQTEVITTRCHILYVTKL